MSNVSKGKSNTVREGSYFKLPLDVRIETLRLYIQYGSSNRVAEDLGISGSSVRDRLYAMGAVLRPIGYTEGPTDAWREHNEQLLEKLEYLAEHSTWEAWEW